MIKCTGVNANGGQVQDTMLLIRRQSPKAVPLEVSFEGHYPVAQVKPVITSNEISFEFDGIGFALVSPGNIPEYGDRNYVFETEMYIDGELVERVKLPTAENKRRFTPFWKISAAQAPAFRSDKDPEPGGLRATGSQVCHRLR